MDDSGAAALPGAAQNACVEILTRGELQHCPRWSKAFASQRKDHRFYDIVENTIEQGFEYRYFALKDAGGRIRAIQPFFLVDQDLLAGTGPSVQTVARWLRRFWPGFMCMRTLMVGCAVGEGHLDDGDVLPHTMQARLLAPRRLSTMRAG